MKKHLILLFSLALVLMFAGFANAATIKMKMAENQPPDYPTTIGDKEFARIVKEKTGGRIDIEVFAGGVLGDEKSVIEAVQLGGIELARVNAQPLSDFAKSLRILSLPYLFRDSDHLWKVLDGPIGNALLVELGNNRMMGLAFYDSGSRSFYNSKKEIKTPEDMNGLKIRVQQSELMMDLIKALGASPTPMPYADVYTGLQSGVIDGAENNWPSYFSTSHYEVAKNFTLDHHSRTPELVIISKAVWDKLSPEDRKILQEAARASEAVQKKAWADYEKKSIEAVKKAGNKITEVDPSDFAKWQNAVEPLYKKFGAGYEKLIEDIKKTM